jgi:hypothetical protein
LRERDALSAELLRLRGFQSEVEAPPSERGWEVEKEVQRPKLRIGTTWVNGYKTCKQTATRHCDDAAEGFAKAMRSWGGHTWEFNLKNAQGVAADWIDPAFGGSDNAAGRGADSVEFAYLATHGGIFTDKPDPYWVATFDQTKCYWPSDQARLGNGKLKWIVLDACQSLQRDKTVVPWKTWSQVFEGLHTIFGFNRNVSDAWWSNDRGKVFGFAVASDHEMADAWIDAAYSWWLDDYPAALAAGVDAKDAHRRLETERLSSNLAGIPRADVKNFHWMERS